MNKPLIGVMPLYDKSKESYWMLPGYMKGIEAAGGIPVMLPMTSHRADIDRLAHTFDGFLFTGGQDINPMLYHESKEAACGELYEERDVFECALFEQVLALDKPAFGICRGLQLFNVLLGGSLYQDLPSQRMSERTVQHKQKPPYSVPVHQVYIQPDSWLSKLLNKDSIAVNSYHHQGIKQLSAQLQVAAVAEDGLVEAVELPEKHFVRAVQWHPEFCYTVDADSLNLFRQFVLSCNSSYQ